MLKTLLFSSLFMFGLLACNSSAVTESKPVALQVIDEGGLNIPVYDESSLSHFLHAEDDKIHVVNFWATWCAPCVKELPDFEELKAEYSEDEVEILMISLDFEEAFEKKLPEFVKKNMTTDVVVVLPESEQNLIEKVDKNWNGAIPVTVIYDKNKRYFIDGSTSFTELNEQIQKFKAL